MGHQLLSLPLSWIRIGKGGASSNLVIPDLPESLISLHSIIIVPTISIEADSKLKVAAIFNRSVDVIPL